jgi:hypothetical protein
VICFDGLRGSEVEELTLDRVHGIIIAKWLDCFLRFGPIFGWQKDRNATDVSNF